MIQRCENPECTSFYRYGGRGIAVCKRWKDSFEAFLADVGEKPTERHSIDRIDNDGNYEPGNVRWSAPKQQSRNMRTTRFLTFQGETLCAADWAEKLGVARSVINSRISRGWSHERALTAPVARAITQAAAEEGTDSLSGSSLVAAIPSLGRLRTLELVTRGQEIRASDALFGDGR